MPENEINVTLGKITPYTANILKRCENPLQVMCSLQTHSGGTKQGKTKNKGKIIYQHTLLANA